MSGTVAVTRDINVMDTTIDGKSAAVTVAIDNSATLSTGTPSAGGSTAGAGGNAIDIDISGNGEIDDTVLSITTIAY